MLSARENFNRAIKDAEQLLEHFDNLNLVPSGDLKVAPIPPSNAEVLKRAGLIMALTAWETYVEDRVQEAVARRLGEGNDSFQNQFLKRHLVASLKTFHTPDSAKSTKLFADYLGVDVSEQWRWNHFEPERVRKHLDALVKLRGDVVHRARGPANGNEAHPVNRDHLRKSIRFIKDLVDATEKATEPRGSTNETGGASANP